MRLKYPAKIGQQIPDHWKEGEDYSQGAKLAVGDLVVLRRSDGALRFGELTGPVGPEWQNAWEVAVTVTSEGQLAAVRTEEGTSLWRIGRKPDPAAASMSFLPQMPAGGIPVLLRMGTQRVLQEAADQLAAAAERLSPALAAAADQITEAGGKAAEELLRQMEAARAAAEARQEATLRAALERKAVREDMLSQRRSAAAQKEAEVQARRSGEPSFAVSEFWDSATDESGR